MQAIEGRLMKYEIRKVTNSGKQESEHRGYVIAADWHAAGKQAIANGLIHEGESLFAIPDYANQPVRCGDGNIPL